MDNELTPTPTAPSGAPLPAAPAWLAGWQRRLSGVAMPPATDRTVPVPAVAASSVTAPSTPATEEDFWAQVSISPVLGEARVVEGTALREVTFLWEGDQPEVMVHINSLTDAHRHDITPALLKRIPGTRIRHISYLLPEDILAGYRFVTDTHIPRDVGAARPGWKRIHERGVPDPRNPRTLPHPLGETSSMLVMPGFAAHEAWDPARPARHRGERRTLRTEPHVSPARTVFLYTPPEAVTRLLVLFDGDRWDALNLPDALDRFGAPGLAVAMVSAISPEDRQTDLPHPERIAAILRVEVLPAVAEALGQVLDPTRIIVAGQSYGGLAAGALVLEHPDIAHTGIVQSGSFHFRANTEPSPHAEDPGDVSERLASRRPGPQTGRLIMQLGSEEGILVPQGRLLRDRARAAGYPVSYREVRGGHDFAWWSHGLFTALEEALHPSGV
ncbi:enterochelin esterase domain-containing protein [Mycetocola sp. JXN-3]|uniref:enterochelin esterase domain-containing protein n=1 Tax=Mycetocola sp. JXN-3 TaxID=2116510 RepID=UPI00165D0B35|nr:enterochelin esterase domain-containing protein [Mycetocola sp. JXN-3]